MIDKHGLKIVGVKKVSGETKWLYPYCGCHYQVNYDLSTGEVWCTLLTNNNYIVYYNDNNIGVCNAMKPMTMQDVADAVDQAVYEHKMRLEWNNSCA